MEYLDSKSPREGVAIFAVGLLMDAFVMVIQLFTYAALRRACFRISLLASTRPFATVLFRVRVRALAAPSENVASSLLTS